MVNSARKIIAYVLHYTKQNVQAEDDCMIPHD